MHVSFKKRNQNCIALELLSVRLNPLTTQLVKLWRQMTGCVSWLIYFCFRSSFGARLPWWCFATRSSARRSMNRTKPQRANLMLQIEEPKPKSLWWWGYFSSALPLSILYECRIHWLKPETAATAVQRKRSTLPRKPHCGCLQLMSALTRLFTSSCAECSGRDSWPRSAKTPRSLPNPH